MKSPKLICIGLLMLLGACASDEPQVVVPTPYEGTYVSQGDGLRMVIKSDSSVIADEGALPITVQSILVSVDGYLYQVTSLDYMNLKLEVAKNPAKYGGSNWTLSLVNAAIKQYKVTYTTADQKKPELCLEAKPFNKCFDKV